MIYFNWRLITLQYCGGFRHRSAWISHGCTCVSPSWTPSHLPLHPIPQGGPRALLHALNLHWSSISRTVIYVFGLPCSSACKKSTCKAGDPSSIPGLGRSPGEGKGYTLQYSGLENSMDCIVHGVAKSQTQLSNFHFTLDPIGLSLPSFLLALETDPWKYWPDYVQECLACVLF